MAMHIDYDGINSFIDEQANRCEAGLISDLSDAMRDGSITRVSIQLCWEICDVCHGDGGHSNRLGVINLNEWSDDEIDGYFNGRYDVTCERCNGSGKVRVIDESVLPDDVASFINEYRNSYFEDLCERRSEMMYGA